MGAPTAFRGRTPQLWPLTGKPVSAEQRSAHAVTNLPDESDQAPRPAENDRCPACGMDEGIRFLGAGLASLASVAVTQLFTGGELVGAERKTLLFNDSVQDAAYRAGFVANRSYGFSLRALLASRLQAGTPVRLNEVIAGVIGAASDPATLAAVVPPDLHDDPGVDALLSGGMAQRPTWNLIGERLAFASVLEVGLRSRQGRTLELTRTAAAEVAVEDLPKVTALCRDLLLDGQHAALLEVPGEADFAALVRGLLERLRVLYPYLHLTTDLADLDPTPAPLDGDARQRAGARRGRRGDPGHARWSVPVASLAARGQRCVGTGAGPAGDAVHDRGDIFAEAAGWLAESGYVPDRPVWFAGARLYLLPMVPERYRPQALALLDYDRLADEQTKVQQAARLEDLQRARQLVDPGEPRGPIIEFDLDDPRCIVALRRRRGRTAGHAARRLRPRRLAVRRTRRGPRRRSQRHRHHPPVPPVVPIDVRAAGAVILLHGTPVTRIVQLTHEAVEHHENASFITLGEQPVLMPPAITRLVITQAAASHRPVPTGTSTWRFPGRLAGRPTAAKTLTQRLRIHGIDVKAACNTAVLTLATDLPAAVLSKILGIHINTAVDWTRHAARDWATYLAARAAERQDRRS
jgi:hypothetical protein